MASQAHLNTLKLADETDALRRRVKELEKQTEDLRAQTAELRQQNVTDQKNINEIDRAYTAHLDRDHRNIP